MLKYGANRLTGEQHSPMLLSICKYGELSLNLDDAVSWDIIHIGGSLNAVACKALLLRVVM
jgi:hypothetical protein